MSFVDNDDELVCAVHAVASSWRVDSVRQRSTSECQTEARKLRSFESQTDAPTSEGVR